MPSEDTLLSALHDHYKDSFEYLSLRGRARDRLLAYLLVVMTVLLFQIYSPEILGASLSAYLKKQLELSEAPDISFVYSVIWFGFLALLIKYYQLGVYIERQYAYIHGLEDRLNAMYGGLPFTREGKFYLKDYPFFSSWTNSLYTVFFPLLIILVVVTKTALIVCSFLSDGWNPLLVVDFLVVLFALVSTVLYLLHIHRKK